LKTQAVARVYLDNIPNIQSSWVTQGLKIGQLALFFGANDMGSLMIEENVVASAGTVHYLTLEQIKNAIREAGYIPRQRNVFYQYIDCVEKGEQRSEVKGQGSGVRGQGREVDSDSEKMKSGQLTMVPAYVTPDS
jgi:2-iminoacetate synthase ThiH